MDYVTKDIYQKMLFNEAKEKDILKVINKWEKTHLANAKDKKKVQKNIIKIATIIKQDMEEFDKISEISKVLVDIAKQYKEGDALDGLSSIIELI